MATFWDWRQSWKGRHQYWCAASQKTESEEQVDETQDKINPVTRHMWQMQPQGENAVWVVFQLEKEKNGILKLIDIKKKPVDNK